MNDLTREWLGRDPQEVIAERFKADPIEADPYVCPQCDGSGTEWTPDGERSRVCGICGGTGELRPRVKSNDPDEEPPF